ncbi:MAG: YlxM family DNA-binding protein [Eubacteriaceae bacterium]|nr:YlxM family DNA-binding protein [Eubacteriaceae bacterium]
MIYNTSVMEDTIDKRFRMACLFDLYGQMLTEKQRESLQSYYSEDYSLSEIASHMGVSRQAAFDLIKRTEKLLEEYEEALKLYERYSQNLKLLKNLKTLCAQNAPALELIEQLEENL